MPCVVVANLSQYNFTQFLSVENRMKNTWTPPAGGGALPCKGYIGMCRCEGYGFQAVYSRIRYINQGVWVQNRVSFFTKLTGWLKILSKLRKAGIAIQKYKKIKSVSLNLRKSASTVTIDGGIWGVYSSIGQQNSTELALVQAKGSRIPAWLW